MFRSTTPDGLAGTMRLPSISTRVRVVPRPRSSTLAWPPFDGLFDVLVTDGTNCGSVFSTASTVVALFCSNNSRPTVTTGLAASKSWRTAIREPVTTISSSRSCAVPTGP